MMIDEKKYRGSIFGFNYSMDFDTDDEFTTWLISKLKGQIPVDIWVQIVTKLLRQSEEYQTARQMIIDHEQRIRALEKG